MLDRKHVVMFYHMLRAEYLFGGVRAVSVVAVPQFYSDEVRMR
jgi:hypothetical protein